MFQDLLPIYPFLVPFLLVLFRVVGVFVFVPVFANQAIPGNVKVLLALAVSVCLWPVVPKMATLPNGLVELTVAIAGEMSVGLLMGMLVALVFTGMQMGAHLLSQQMGLSLAATYDPMFDEQSTVIEQLAFWLSMAVFFAIGGHRELINALVQSYQAVPMGHAVDARHAVDTLLGAIGAALQLAARVGAPGLVAFFLATLAMGFIARSMPQINLMTLGISVNIMVGIGMIMLGLASWAMVAQGAWRGMFDTMGRAFAGS